MIFHHHYHHHRNPSFAIIIFCIIIIITISSSILTFVTSTFSSTNNNNIINNHSEQQLVYTIPITIDQNLKKNFHLNHKNLPLALEYATLFCTENNIHDKRCPPQIVNKLIIDNHIKYNEKQIKKILKNNYFTLEKKIEIHKLNENVNTQYDNYKLLSYMNGNKCFSMTDTNNAEIIQSEEPNIINTISKLTPAQIEFNELFGLSAFQQLDVTNAINCYNMLLLEKPDNIIYNFNYGALLANIGNHSKSVHYLSIAANRKFFPAALALAKSTIGSFNFTMNKYYLNLGSNAAKTNEEKLLIHLRNATLLPGIYMTENNYEKDMQNSIIILKHILDHQLNLINVKIFQSNSQFVEYAFYGALDQCTHHNPHTDMVIEAKKMLSTILRRLSPARNFMTMKDGISSQRVEQTTSTVYNVNNNNNNNNNNNDNFVEIRIGFATSFFRQHSVAKYTCPLMRKLKEYRNDNNNKPIKMFYIVGIGIGGNCHPNNKFLNENHNIAFKNCRDSTDLYIHYQDGATDELFGTVRNLHLDILIYPEIGLDSTVYLMSLARLAPIQISHLGNAVTHGINTIDYVVHSLKFLPGSTLNIRKKRLVQKTPFPVCASRSIGYIYDGLNHTEKLLCFETTGLYLEKPNNHVVNPGVNDDDTLLKAWKLLKEHNIHLRKPGDNNTTAANDDESYDHMYFLPHTPLKFSNGERDHLYEQMLTNDPKAKLVMLQPFRNDAAEVIRTIIKERWEKQNLNNLLGNNNSRYVWLPFVPLDMYIALGKLANVVLDICPNGMGVSAVEMLVAGAPFVSTPYCQKVLRLSQGIYETIGVTNMICKNDKEFLDLTFKLANDVVFRNEMKALVLEKVDLLFENVDIFDEWVGVLKGLMVAV